ncbi:uncharacterized protein BBA_05087 [Beauveria bassiana ARSEF 2860]|uniref:Uncharacterized protein n=1 Tax=Beauveria bassiana (strain ARSEF 2860) TaxID=655819 RepID=J5JUA4_BEAB2|nr:uncharacterized protein BBA_05087 [Beauveria bassiana ARSEF 2860]EJP66116.1 hypothetical protein BBA_05087 [Beauveria bassiana ARSEF 2860]
MHVLLEKAFAMVATPAPEFGLHSAHGQGRAGRRCTWRFQPAAQRGFQRRQRGTIQPRTFSGRAPQKSVVSLQKATTSLLEAGRGLL